MKIRLALLLCVGLVFGASAALAAEETPATVEEHYASLEYNADDCIECHLCERNCPFGVKIALKMERARRIFG